MTLELTKLAPEMHAMGEDLAGRARSRASLVEMARRLLGECSTGGSNLSHSARAFRAAIPTSEPIDAVLADPGTPDRFTVIGVDGSQMEPDRHGIAYFHLINTGSLIYRHGSGQAPEPSSQPTLGYAEEDIYEGPSPVSGNLLDVRRDLAEITRVADLCEREARRSAEGDQAVPTVALVDGTLLLWVLDDRSPERQAEKASSYVTQMDRIRSSGAILGAFASRPRRTEVARLLHLAHLGGELNLAKREPNPLERVPDGSVFAMLPPGARSALFVSPSPVNHRHYAPAGHRIHFCYVNVSEADSDPAVARLEMPEWVACDPEKRDLLHGAVVAQSSVVGDYPYALARADELAFISGPEREELSRMVGTALMQAGLQPSLSPKANQKAMTRGGRRRR